MESHEFIEEFGYGLLVDVVDQVVDDLRAGGEHVGEELLLLAVEQEGH